ncbi:DUF4350 domain-containing protein [Leptolyngbya sp. KIOST-1]|uniref:DUF4350 domain-containing protein n=1 Tax=Leptolyngbya sp. KIOST-1 TaxID=1229172 RepID=UPI000689DEBE|nr:DUF4350 domain-containing protein [Leptolyngbya sp. KIOST-1]
MTRSLPLTRRPLLGGLLALALLLGLLVLGGPTASQLESGSTWHRGPAGYSAWYESLEQQGIAVQRWQRPIEALIEQLEGVEDATITLVQSSPAGAETLVAVLPDFVDRGRLPDLLPWMPAWVEAGHRLVILGVKTPVTAAPFSQTLTSEAGAVQIDTRRRYSQGATLGIDLEDAYGAVVWQQSFGAGPVTLVATPHLGANAYLNQPGNFALLTELVAGGRVWIDEYLHGYRDQGAIAADLGGDSWINYLARTPLVILFAQALALTLIALLAYNHRLGRRRSLATPSLDNSRAYIQALAGVLHKANSHDFVVQTVSQAERLQLQKALGLGSMPLPIEQVQRAWDERPDCPAIDLAALLRPPLPRTESQLRDWLKRVQSLHYPDDTTRDTTGDTSGHD